VRTVNVAAAAPGDCTNMCLVACAPLCIITLLAGSYIVYSYNEHNQSSQIYSQPM
jgi:hypothetical protein